MSNDNLFTKTIADFIEGKIYESEDGKVAKKQNGLFYIAGDNFIFEESNDFSLSELFRISDKRPNETLEFMFNEYKQADGATKPYKFDKLVQSMVVNIQSLEKRLSEKKDEDFVKKVKVTGKEPKKSTKKKEVKKEE